MFSVANMDGGGAKLEKRREREESEREEEGPPGGLHLKGEAPACALSPYAAITSDVAITWPGNTQCFELPEYLPECRLSLPLSGAGAARQFQHSVAIALDG